MRIGNVQILPEEDDFDAEVFSFLNHQEPLEFTSSTPGGLFRPVPIPTMAPSSLDTYNFRPVQSQCVRKSSNKSESRKQRKSRRRKLKESREETMSKQTGETMAGGDCGEKLQDKHRFEIKEITEKKDTNETTVARQSRLEDYLPESVLCIMCQRDMTEFTFARCSIQIGVSNVSSMASLSSLDKQSSCMEAITSPVDVRPQEKKTTSILTRLRRFARRAAKRFI